MVKKLRLYTAVVAGLSSLVTLILVMLFYNPGGVLKKPPANDVAAAERVRRYCALVQPVAMPDLLCLHLPDMDDGTFLAAARLARMRNPRLAGDLAAVIVRLNRLTGLRRTTTHGFPGHFDACWLFASQMAVKSLLLLPGLLPEQHQ